MSKLAMINAYSYSPMAGGGILSGVGKLLGKGIKAIGGLFRKKSVQQVLQKGGQIAQKGLQVIAPVAAYTAGEALLSGGEKQSAGASGYYGYRRRSRGITARELRGYRKVANLLHKEGMVSRRARGRK